MFGGLRRFIAAELIKLADLIAHGNNRVAGLTDEVRELTAAVIRLEGIVEKFVERWSWPAPGQHPNAPDPLPPAENEDETPLERHSKR